MVKTTGEAYGVGAEPNATMVRLSIPGTYGYLNQSEPEADASVPNRFANNHGGHDARRGGVMAFRGSDDIEPQFVCRNRVYESYRAIRAAVCPGDGRIHGIAC
jgi:hypothetical protein